MLTFLHSRSVNLSQSATNKWILQTFLVGYSSLRLLNAYLDKKKSKQKSWWCDNQDIFIYMFISQETSAYHSENFSHEAHFNCRFLTIFVRSEWFVDAVNCWHVFNPLLACYASVNIILVITLFWYPEDTYSRNLVFKIV